jgi:hypothetical protein
MQFQSPVSLRLLPTLPSLQQLKGPVPTGSQTERGGASKSNGGPGSKTHRVMASTNASSLAAVKQASQRNRDLFDKISTSVSNISAALRADGLHGADAAEATIAAQELHNTVNGIVRPPVIQQIQTASRTTGSTASGKARPRGAKLSSTQKADADISSPNPLIEQIERLMLVCSVKSNERCPPHRGQQKGKLVSKDTKPPVTDAAPADEERRVVRVKHVPLGCVVARQSSVDCMP